MIKGILETSIYAPNLAAAEHFYSTILALVLVANEENRHLFYRCGPSMLLVFNPDHTALNQTTVDGEPIPLHGASGPGHVAFYLEADALEGIKARLAQYGVGVESAVHWPNGAHSIYTRDPAGNSIEFATKSLWNLSDV